MDGVLHLGHSDMTTYDQRLDVDRKLDSRIISVVEMLSPIKLLLAEVMITECVWFVIPECGNAMGSLGGWESDCFVESCQI